jgi:excisionase family DNA binding protein
MSRGNHDRFAQASHVKSPGGVIAVFAHRARQGFRIYESLRSQMHVKPISPAQTQTAIAGEETTRAAVVVSSPAEPFRVKDIAAALRVDPSTVYAEIKAGRLDAYRVGQGRGTIRIPRAALRKYVDERGIPTDVLRVEL